MKYPLVVDRTIAIKTKNGQNEEWPKRGVGMKSKKGRVIRSGKAKPCYVKGGRVQRNQRKKLNNNIIGQEDQRSLPGPPRCI